MDARDPGRTAQLELIIGARMRTRRRQLGLSQSDLAERLGVSFQQVQKYERGANRVAASTLLAAAQALGTTVAWLVGEEASGRDDDEDVFRALVPARRAGDPAGVQRHPRRPHPRALLALAREMATRDPRPSLTGDAALSTRAVKAFGAIAGAMRRPARPLAERRPRRAQISAEQLASLSHEFRTPAERRAGHGAAAGRHPADRRAARLCRRASAIAASTC